MTAIPVLPRYPVYIPSKGRWQKPYTAARLDRDGVPFRLVVEEPEAHHYISRFGADRVLVLPFTGRGLIGSRNWIKAHAIGEGHKRHWQLDDNIRSFYYLTHGRRFRCLAGPALRTCEDFTDRWANVAISGLNYFVFGLAPGMPPFYLNVHVYSCTLVNNAIPHGWRSAYNDDTDICLQVLADGWCTVLVNAFLAEKIATMRVRGGNTDALYQGDGRLKMARSLERLWPGVVSVDRRFQRPQHVVRDAWQKFDTPLIPAPGVDVTAPVPYTFKVRQRAEVKSPSLRDVLIAHYTPDAILTDPGVTPLHQQEGA